MLNTGLSLQREIGRKRVYIITVAPSSFSQSPDLEVTEANKHNTTSLGKQGKLVYTMSQERRIYTVEAADPPKGKRERFYNGGTYFSSLEKAFLRTSAHTRSSNNDLLRPR